MCLFVVCFVWVFNFWGFLMGVLLLLFCLLLVFFVFFGGGGGALSKDITKSQLRTTGFHTHRLPSWLIPWCAEGCVWGVCMSA